MNTWSWGIPSKAALLTLGSCLARVSALALFAVCVTGSPELCGHIQVLQAAPLLKTPPPCTLHPSSHGSTGRSQNTITSTQILPPIISEPLHLLQVAEWLRVTKLVSRTFFATSTQVVHPSLWSVDAVGSHCFARKLEPQRNWTMKGPKLKSYYSVI